MSAPAGDRARRSAGGLRQTGRAARLAGAAIALGLVAVVLVLAGPAEVVRLFRESDARGILLAWVTAGLVATFRGLRLALLLPPGSLGPARAIPVAAAAQAAAALMPARLGELALPWLLRRECGWRAARGMGTLVAARGLDVVGLGAWAAAGAAWSWGADQPAVLAGALLLLVVPPLLLPVALLLAERLAASFLAPRSGWGRCWAERITQLAESVAGIRERPLRLLAALTVTLLQWGLIWLYTWQLVRAMGYPWPLLEVAAGSALGGMANLLPFNLVANLGTLEAGWTAAFVALGRPVAEAAATGLASHLWALLFIALWGAIGWLLVHLRRPITAD
jgi:uncharacterized protein (TIRG00374 family)